MASPTESRWPRLLRVSAGVVLMVVPVAILVELLVDGTIWRALVHIDLIASKDLAVSGIFLGLLILCFFLGGCLVVGKTEWFQESDEAIAHTTTSTPPLSPTLARLADRLDQAVKDVFLDLSASDWPGPQSTGVTPSIERAWETPPESRWGARYRAMRVAEVDPADVHGGVAVLEPGVQTMDLKLASQTWTSSTSSRWAARYRAMLVADQEHSETD